MSKLSFRARALDPSKPMPIYLAEDLPDLPEYSAINRAVPQMPSGMEKEEESEHHLQRAICTGLIIPTPEVYDSTDSEFYDKYYPADYKLPKQLIHMQPLNLEQDIPDYDMDSSDEVWVTSHGKKLDIEPLKFEIMMDRLEKSSGQTVVTLNEAKALLKQDDEVSIAVYDYWLNKRLKTQHPLILYVKTENRGNMTPNNPYLAFRRRTEKMQTRKNRKNDESSYEKMLKLRRELSRAVTLLEMIKRREKLKREQLHLSIEIYEKRYQAQDFHGQLLSELTTSATRASRPAFAPIYSNQFPSLTGGQGVNVGGTATSSGGVYIPSGGTSSQYNAGAGSSHKRDNESLSSRKEKRQYKKRKLKIQKDRSLGGSGASGHGVGTGGRGADALGSGAMGSSGSGSSGNHHHHHHHHHHHGSQHHPHHHHPHLHHHQSVGAGTVGGSRDGLVPGGHDHLLAGGDHVGSSDDEELANLAGGTSPEEEYAYAFRRSKHSQYHRPRADGYGNWPWTSREENGSSDPRFRFTLTSLRYPRPRCIGFARRRLGRGGRVIIDRVATDLDELWSRLDYTIVESETIASLTAQHTEIVAAEPEDESEVVGDLRPTMNQSQRTASVSSNCSVGEGTPTSVVVSLKPPRQLTFGLTQPLVNGGDALEPYALGKDPSVDDRTNAIDGGVQRVRRRLVLKQEYPEVAPPQVASDGYDESDGGDGSEQQFLASIGLMNKMKEAARQVLSDMHDDDERALLAAKARDEVRRRRVCPTDGRTFPPAMVDEEESDNGSGVHNSDSIVIKSEEDATTAAALERTRTASLEEESSCVVKLELDQSVMAMSPKSAGGGGGVLEPEDFEQLIDSVNSIKGPRTVIVRRSNSISSSTDPTPTDTGTTGGSEVLVAVSEENGTLTGDDGGVGGGSSPSRLHDATREDIDAVYKDLLNDIQSNWLHFRPKTPSPCPDDVLTLEEDEVGRQGVQLDDQLEACIGLTDRNRITLELQALEEGLPETIFANRSGSLFRTVPYALDSLLEPHPLSVTSDEAEAVDATGTGLRTHPTEVKLEMSGSSGDHNVTTGSDASSSDINLGLGLNESHEDSEKMLDNILQECAVDDPKSLHQTSNFWNGLLDDVVPTGLEADGQKGGAARAREAEVAGRLGGTAKLGYHCDLVGYGRSTVAAERRPGKSKRRKVLKRCSYLVGSSYFTVKNLPKEEIFQPLLDANGEPICLDPVELDAQVAATELRDCSTVPIDDLLPPSSVGMPERDVMEPVEIKMEEDVLQGASSLDSPLPPISSSLVDRIKLEPPDEVISRGTAVSETGGALAPGTIQFLPSFGGSPTVTLPSTAATIKLEAPSPVPSSSFNHINAIASPATIMVSQPSSTVFSTSGVPTMVSVSLAQGGPATLHQLVPTSTTSALGTTMLVMQSMPTATVASISSASHSTSNSIIQGSPTVSISSASGQTSFLITNSGNSATGVNSSTGSIAAGSAGLGTSSVSQSIAGSILLQSSAGGAVVSSTPSPASTTLASSSATTLLSSGTPIVVTVPPLPAGGANQQQHTVVTHVLPTSSNSVVPTTAATPIVVSATGTGVSGVGTTTVQSVLQAAAQGGVSGNSYILQHNSTPIVLSHQQMQQLTSGGGGNIVTVGGQQVVTAKQHHGETYVLTQSSPLKKQINGPTDGSKNATSAAVTAQNLANQKFHALLSQKLSHKPTDLNKKQLEMIRKALVASPKMIVKSANHPLAQQQQQQLHGGGPVGGLVAGHHQQTAPAQQQQYNVIHQNSLNSPITIVSAQSTGQPGTQNKIILTSSPQLLQQATTVGGATAGQLLAAAASSHGKIQLTTVQQSPQNAGAGGGVPGGGGPTLVTLDQSGQGTATVGTVQQQVKLDKNRILYATNIKNSRGQFLAQLNPKLVNIIQPMQQQKLINSVTLQQQQQQQLLHNQNAVNSLHGTTTTTTILNSKGQTVQRIPTVSIRTQQQPLQQQQQQQQQQQASQQATLLDTGPTHTVVMNNANNIKFIQAAAAAAAAAAGGSGNAVVNANSNSGGARLVSVSSAGASVTPTVVSISSAGPAGATSSGPEPGTGGSGSNCTQSTPTSANSVVGVTNSIPSTGGGGPPATTTVAPVAITVAVAATTATSATTGGATGPAGTVVSGGIGCSNGGGTGGKSNPPASINITNR